MNLFNPQRYSHGDRLTLDGVPVRLRVNPRATRVSLRIDQARREVVATAPTPRLLNDAVAFARSRAVWIAGQMVRLPLAATLTPDQTIEVLGQLCVLEAAPGRAKLIAATDDQPMRILAKDDDRFAATVVRLLKAEARRVLGERTAFYAQALGQSLPTVAITDARGRWGSCTPARRGVFAASVHVGSIRYSWRLILATYEVMDYVAAHECAHLIEANHGPKFWALVASLVGDHKPYRAWLRTHGPRLHAFGQ